MTKDNPGRAQHPLKACLTSWWENVWRRPVPKIHFSSMWTMVWFIICGFQKMHPFIMHYWENGIFIIIGVQYALECMFTFRYCFLLPWCSWCYEEEDMWQNDDDDEDVGYFLLHLKPNGALFFPFLSLFSMAIRAQCSVWSFHNDNLENIVIQLTSVGLGYFFFWWWFRKWVCGIFFVGILFNEKFAFSTWKWNVHWFILIPSS